MIRKWQDNDTERENMKQPKFYRKFNYDRALIPNAHLSSLDNAITIEDAKDKTGFSIGYPGWGLVYYILMSHLHHEEYNLIVETGTNQGCTTIMLAQALKDSNCNGKVYTVELDPENYKIALNNFQKAGISRYIDAVNADSKKALEELIRKHSDIRVAFLDASHLYNDILEEFEIILPSLGPQSIVIFDNTYLIAEAHEDQRVNGALKEILRRHGGNLVNLEFVSWYTPGIAIWQKFPFDSKQLNKSKGAGYLSELTKNVEGRIVQEEAELLYHLASEGFVAGVIVEIGSFQGYSTIWLSSGSKDNKRGKVYAVDPHNTELHGRNELIFRENLKKADVEDYVVPIIKTSTEAAADWDKPIRLLWIDGAHDYENVKNDFLHWERHLIDDGIVAFHDAYCIFWPDVGKFIEDYILSSDSFADLNCINTIIYARKVKDISPQQKIEKEKFIESISNRARAVEDFLKVELMIERGNNKNAEDLLGKCEKNINDYISPEYRMLNLVSIGNCYKKTGNFIKAEEIYREILNFKSGKNLVNKRYRAILGLADLYTTQNRYKDAAEKYEEAMAEDGLPIQEKYRALIGLGRCNSALKKYHDAEKMYEEALTLDHVRAEEKVVALLEFGKLYTDEGRDEYAERKYLKALSLENIAPIQKYRLLNRLGNIYLNRSKFGESEQRFTEALSIQGVPGQDRYHALIGLGKCLHLLKQYAHAEVYYREALSYDDISDKCRLDAATLLIDCCFDQENFREVKVLCKEIVSFGGISDEQKNMVLESVKERMNLMSAQYGGANV